MALFKEKLAGQRSVLVVNPRGLGDVIHSLPAVAALRRSLPELQIDFLASEHSDTLFGIVPYVRQVLTVPYYPRPKTRWERYGRRFATARQIRRNRYDAVINLQAIDSTMTLIALTTASRRLAVRSIGTPVRMGWFYSDIVDRRWCNQPAYRFMLEAMAQAGFATDGCALGPDLVDLSGIHLSEEISRPYFHLSLLTSKISRQLPPAEAQRLINELLHRYPAHDLIVTCSAAPHEVAAIKTLIPPGIGDRLQVYAGTLNLVQLARLLQGAEAHIGPDTGSVHLAWLVGTRTVSWFPNHQAMLAWIPYGPQHRVLLSVREQVTAGQSETDSRTLRARTISAELIVEQLDDLLRASLPPKQQWPGSEQLGLRCLY